MASAEQGVTDVVDRIQAKLQLNDETKKDCIGTDIVSNSFQPRNSITSDHEVADGVPCGQQSSPASQRAADTVKGAGYGLLAPETLEMASHSPHVSIVQNIILLRHAWIRLCALRCLVSRAHLVAVAQKASTTHKDA